MAADNKPHTTLDSRQEEALPSVGDKCLGQRQEGAVRVVREPSVWVKRTDPCEEENMVRVHFASRGKGLTACSAAASKANQKKKPTLEAVRDAPRTHGSPVCFTRGGYGRLFGRRQQGNPQKTSQQLRRDRIRFKAPKAKHSAARVRVSPPTAPAAAKPGAHNLPFWAARGQLLNFCFGNEPKRPF